ncbi:hypothetical protein BLNAU_4848 [Blattamonas nauphoetae]|uniref:Uncharacterized protein n=1 Tax=Blattamonas nauphoetae TaxID=2049346 RepID=A0ABQ9Y968_9EUKA|nr:hypothetical protein BLNAU_4848 [Blattamonas nauphoetae]
MLTDLSGTHDIDSRNGIKPPENTMRFFTECLTKFKNGDEKTKMEMVHSVQSQVLSDEQRVGDLCSCVVSSGLLEELCRTLSEPCSDHLFVCVTGLVGVVVSGASLPVRGRVSSLLPSLLGLISKTENGVGEAATRAIGHLCSVCLSSNDVDGILNCGIVEGLCSQCVELISSSNRSESWKTQIVTVIGGLDSLCAGLGEFVRNEKEKKTKEKEEKSTKKSGGQEGIFEDAESEFSLLSRSSSALSLIETTLGEILTELQRQKQSTEMDQERKALRNEVAGVLMEHFPHTFVTGKEKADGVIGLDIGKEREKLESQLQQKMKEMEAERRREKEEMRVEKQKMAGERQREKEEIAHLKLRLFLFEGK